MTGMVKLRPTMILVEKGTEDIGASTIFVYHPFCMGGTPLLSPFSSFHPPSEISAVVKHVVEG